LHQPVINLDHIHVVSRSPQASLRNTENTKLTPNTRYKRDEQPKRVGFWYMGVGIATIIGSLMSFGFQHYAGTLFRAWQIMFLVIGLITISMGAVVICFLPDNPMSARRLSHAEKVAAVERLRENQTGVENKHFKSYQVVQCLTDPQTWLLCLITVAASIPNGAVGSFQSILIRGFGFTKKETALLQIPGGAIAVASVLLATWSAAKYNARALNIMLWSLIGGILGGSLLAFTPEDNRAAKMAGNYLTHVVGAFLPCCYSFAAANQGGHTKKVTMNAILLMSFCLVSETNEKKDNLADDFRNHLMLEIENDC
jgi:sugar phosphate permease